MIEQLKIKRLYLCCKKIYDKGIIIDIYDLELQKFMIIITQIE